MGNLIDSTSIRLPCSLMRLKAKVFGQSGCPELPDADNLSPARDRTIACAQQICASLIIGLIEDKPLIVDRSMLAQEALEIAAIKAPSPKKQVAPLRQCLGLRRTMLAKADIDVDGAEPGPDVGPKSCASALVHVHRKLRSRSTDQTDVTF
jgi:hypothetical protein